MVTQPRVQDFLEINKLKDFDNHRLVFILSDISSNLAGFISIHRGGLQYPAFGATRLWSYNSRIDALKDSLKLSKMMSYKSAMAGLKYGGAKATIVFKERDNPNKKKLLQSYASKVNYLKGNFITGADVGVNDKDLKVLSASSQFMVGTKSDPVKFTADGVFYSLLICLNEIFGNTSLGQKSFAIQGLGKTGLNILQRIYHQSKKIYASDINQNAVNLVIKKFPKVEIVKPSEIKKMRVDVLMPCALSNELDFESLPFIKSKIIIGSANCQLKEEIIGEKLFKLGILYAPDYVVNAGGLMAVVDEYENKSHDPLRVGKKVNKIKTTLKIIIKNAQRHNKPTNIVSNQMAEEIFNKFN